MFVLASLFFVISAGDSHAAASAFVVEKFAVGSTVPSDFAIALESEILRELNRLPGCELAIRASSVSKTRMPGSAIVISGEILEVHGVKPFFRGGPGMAVKVRFRNLDDGKLLHEETMQSERVLIMLSDSEMETATRGLAKRLAKVVKSRFLR